MKATVKKPKHPLLRSLGANVEDLRNKRGWSQRVLADLMKRSPALVSLIESGRTWISPETMTSLAEIFNIPPASLLEKKTRGKPHARVS